MASVTSVEERCLCGNLLARLTPNGVEILCRRCKRKHVIRWLELQEEGDDEAHKELIMD